MKYWQIKVLKTFQRRIDKIIGKLELEAERNYINNIIVELETFQKYLETLERIFQQLEKVELKIKLQKYQFTKNTVAS